MWSVLFGGIVPWVAAIATLLLVLAATLLIIHQVRTSDGDMSVRLRWLGLHVQRSARNTAAGVGREDDAARCGVVDQAVDERRGGWLLPFSRGLTGQRSGSRSLR